MSLAIEVSIDVDTGVGVGAPGECHVEHPDGLHIVDVGSLALDEGWILAALDDAAHDAGGAHAITSHSAGAGVSPRILAAAYSIALTML